MNPKAKSPAVTWNSLKSLIFTQTFTVKMYSAEVYEMWTKLLMPATLSFATSIFVLMMKGWSVDGGRCGTIWSAWDQLSWTSFNIFGHLHSIEFRSQATRILPEDNESWAYISYIIYHQNKSVLNWSKNTSFLLYLHSQSHRTTGHTWSAKFSKKRGTRR